MPEIAPEQPASRKTYPISGKRSYGKIHLAFPPSRLDFLPMLGLTSLKRHSTGCSPPAENDFRTAFKHYVIPAFAVFNNFF